MLIANYVLLYFQPITIRNMTPQLSISLNFTNPLFKALADNNQMIIASRLEQCINVSLPCSSREDYVPFNVSFDIQFVAGSIAFVTKHCGLYLGIISHLYR